MAKTALRIARVRQLASSGEAARIREGADLTRGDVARDIGVSVHTVRRWELGERAPTGVAALRYEALLASLLDLTESKPA